MIDKLELIKQILETDEETDKKILSLLFEAAKNKNNRKEKIIHIEVRDCKRKPVSISADINTGVERIQADAADVSLTGAFIRTDQKLKKGENIAVRMMTDDGELAFIAEVVRIEETGVGVLIKTISENHQKKLQQFIHSL